MNQINRRDFCKAGIVLSAGLLPLGSIPDIPVAVPVAREAGYRMILWTPNHTFIEYPVSEILAEWGNLVFLGQSKIKQTATFSGVCVMRPNAEIVMSRTLGGPISVISGDQVKTHATLTWPHEGSVEQLIEAGSRVPRGRVVRRGFEPKVHANKGPSITRDDLELFFPDRFA